MLASLAEQALLVRPKTIVASMCQGGGKGSPDGKGVEAGKPPLNSGLIDSLLPLDYL